MFSRLKAKIMAAVMGLMGRKDFRPVGAPHRPYPLVPASVGLPVRSAGVGRLYSSWGKWRYPRKLSPEARRMRQIAAGYLTGSNGLLYTVSGGDRVHLDSNGIRRTFY